MSNAALNEIKKLIDLKVQDGYLSHEEVEEIVEGTRFEYKELPLTDQDMLEIETYASQRLTQALNKKRPVTKLALVMIIINFAVSFLQIPIIVQSLEYAHQYAGVTASDYITTITIVLWYAIFVLIGIGVILDVVAFIFVFKHKPAQAARVLYGSVAKTVLLFICAMQLSGLTWQVLLLVLYFIWQSSLSVYLHPTLRAERLLAKDLLKLSTEKGVERGTLGLQEDPKRGYIKLDFFNLFWIFVICSIIGLVAEDVFHMACVWEPGEFHDRAGLLYGPFSPIYGFGGLIMTVCLNRVRSWPAPILFAFCTVIGGIFEYFVSWFLEVSFGITAWDYTGHFLNVGGRTCLLFASMFGIMGMIWIKWALPVMMKLINKIPWRWRYAVTSVCAILMLINCLMTVAALDCWYSRVAGKEPTNFIENYYAQHYDNDWMEKRFESMTIDPDLAGRAE